MVLYNIDGYFDSRCKSGWVEYDHPSQPGTVICVQFVMNAKKFIVHDRSDRKVEPDTILIALLQWLTTRGPRDCKFYVRQINLTAGKSRVARSS